jgi:Transposase zinc-binding domain
VPRSRARYQEAHAGQMLPSHCRAMDDIVTCRTSALGGSLYACDDCGTLDYAELRRAISRGHRNNVGERFCWCPPVERLSRPPVQFRRDHVELSLPVAGRRLLVGVDSTYGLEELGL